MRNTILMLNALLLCAAAFAAPSAENSDAVLPNSPLKERGFPDAGQFNPTWTTAPDRLSALPTLTVAPAAVLYRPIVRHVPPPRPYALVAAPTLPCAPGYCPRLRARADRN